MKKYIQKDLTPEQEQARMIKNQNLTALAISCKENFTTQKFLKIWEEVEDSMTYYLTYTINWIPSYSYNDLITECKTILYIDGILKYQPIVNNKPVSFRYWAIMIMRRHIMSLLSSSKCWKRNIIHGALHLDWRNENDEGNVDTLENILKDDLQLSPIEEIIRDEDNLLINNYYYNFIVDSIKKYVRSKSTIEKYIVFLNLYMNEGRNYNKIAEKMSIKFGKKYNYKSVDNILRYIKDAIRANKANYKD